MAQKPVLENSSEKICHWGRIKALWKRVIRIKQNSRRCNRICFILLHFTAIICTIYETAERKVDLTNIKTNLMNWLWDFFIPPSSVFRVRAPEDVLKSVSVGKISTSHFKHGTTFKYVTEKQEQRVGGKEDHASLLMLGDILVTFKMHFKKVEDFQCQRRQLNIFV